MKFYEHRFIIDNVPVQKIHEDILINIEYFPHVEADNLNSIFTNFIRKFLMEEAPLIRIGIIEDKNGNQILIIDMHHLICDGLSCNLLVEEFIKLYSGETLKELDLQYKDYALWITDFLKSDSLKIQEKYWLDIFSQNIPQPLNLPFDFPRPQNYCSKGKNISLNLDEELRNSLYQIAGETHTSLYMIFLAAFYILFWKITGEEDIVFGIPIAGRTSDEIQDMMGVFINTIAIRNQVDGNKKCIDLINEIKTNIFDAYENQHYPFERLVNKLELSGTENRNPLFDIWINFPDLKLKLTPEQNKKNIVTSRERFLNKSTQFDLAFFITENENGINYSCVYKTSLFKTTTIKYFINEYIILLEQLVGNINQKLYDFKIFNIDKTRKYTDFIPLANKYTKFEKVFCRNSPVWRFEEIAQKYPDKIAVESNETMLSYSNLNKSANRVSHKIMVCLDNNRENRKKDNISILNEKIFKDNNKVNPRIALLFNHDRNMIIAMLSVLKAGMIYVPLDPNHPHERLSYILKETGASLLLTDTNFKILAEQIADYSDMRIPVLNMDDIGEDYSCENPGYEIDQHQIAYIIYTSGSTGKPKGVCHTHSNILNFVRIYTNNLHISEIDKLTLLSTYCVDASIQDIFGALLNGATVFPFDAKANSGMDLIKWLIDKKITIWHSTPTLFRYLIGNICNNIKFNDIRLVVLGGEIVFRQDIDHYKEYFNDKCILVNGFGATESTLITQQFVCKSSVFTKLSIPVGVPVDDFKLFLLDKNKQPVSNVYGTGEIIYTHNNLFPGYWNDRAATEKAFFYNTNLSAKPIYMSGDLGRLLQDGSIEFLGRIDNQVKIRGYRIDLIEIESILNDMKEIKTCAASVFQNKSEEKDIAVHYITSDNEDLDSLRIREYLKKRLPLLMIPTYIVQVNELPMTATGKINRNKLPNPEIGQERIKHEYVAPDNETEKKLVQIWQDILNVDKISILDNFFKLGGHSLKALQILSKASTINIKLTLKQIFNYPTIKQIAHQINIHSKSQNSKKENVAVKYVEKFGYLKERDIKKLLHYIGNKDNIFDAFPLIPMQQAALSYFIFSQDNNKIQQFSCIIDVCYIERMYILRIVQIIFHIRN